MCSFKEPACRKKEHSSFSPKEYTRFKMPSVSDILSSIFVAKTNEARHKATWPNLTSSNMPLSSRRRQLAAVKRHQA